MTEQQIIQKTSDHVKQLMTGEASGHDWWHIYRVCQIAKNIASKEPNAVMFIVELGALLHDIADWKFNDGDVDIGPNTAAAWLRDLQVDEKIIEQVAYIVRHISYKGGTNKHMMQSLEGKIVQDADRLDAIGAIGIGRTFAFGGQRGRLMYDPDKPAQQYTSFEAFKQAINDGTTINHFYEKLLLLKDGMHTNAARQLAEERHMFMERYLEQFYAEWDGKR